MSITGYRLLFIPLLILASCSSSTVVETTPTNDELQAENILLENRSSMLTRENTVLKKENLRLHSETKEQAARIEKLLSDNAAESAKYDSDRTLLAARIRSLEEKLEILNRESTGRIRELIEQARRNESRMTDEITRLNDKILKQQQDFNNRLENLKSEFTRKEYVYMKTLDDMNRDAVARETRIRELSASNDSLTVDLKKLNEKLEHVTGELDETRSGKARIEVRLSDSERECRRLRDECEALKKERDELQQRLSDRVSESSVMEQKPDPECTQPPASPAGTRTDDAPSLTDPSPAGTPQPAR